MLFIKAIYKTTKVKINVIGNFENTIMIKHGIIPDIIPIKNIPIITVYNKIDKTELKKCTVNGEKIYISAKSEEGILLLTKEIVKNIFSNYTECKLLIPFDRGDVVNKIISDETVLNTEYTENDWQTEYDRHPHIAPEV